MEEVVLGVEDVVGFYAGWGRGVRVVFGFEGEAEW